MFDFVRKHNRLFQFVLLVLIVPSFVLFGIQGFDKSGDGAAARVAEVDGHGITQAEWESARQRQSEQLRQSMPGFDPKVLDTPEARDAALDSLIRERVLVATANADHLNVGDERLQRVFRTDPSYAQIRDEQGRVSKVLLDAQGMTSEMFAERVRQDLRLRQVLGGITDAPAVSQATLGAALDALLQQREVRTLRLAAAPLTAKVQVSDADIEAFYKSHEARFRTPEQARIEYVQLDLDSVRKGIAVSDDELKKYYDENAARFGSPELRRSRHILIQVPAGADAKAKADARAQAEAILAEVRKDPSQFAAIAKAKSQDVGSAAQGGDLGPMRKQDLADAFGKALFALKPGEISGVVETEFGFHVIQLDGIDGGQRKPFEEVRAQVESEVREQVGKRRWAEVAEQFTNTVYEQSDSLDPVIAKLKLQKQTGSVPRVPAPGATGPLANGRLLEALFGAEALKNKRNTEAIEVAPNTLVSARIVEHMPARVPPLAEVKDRARAMLVEEKARALARTEAEAKLKQLQAGTSPDALGLGPVQAVSRLNPGTLAGGLVEAALGVDAGKLPAGVVVDRGAAGSELVVVTKVLPRAEMPAQLEPMLRAQYGQGWARAEADAYLEMLKGRFKAAKVGDGASVAATARAALASAPQ